MMKGMDAKWQHLLIHNAWCALCVLSLAAFELAEEAVKSVEKEYSEKLPSLTSLGCPEKRGGMSKKTKIERRNQQ